MKLSTAALLFSCAGLLGGCAAGERADVRSQPRPGSLAAARDNYAAERAARAAETAPVSREDAARRALRSGLSVPGSFRERIRFPAEEPYAVAYRLTLRRGDVLTVRMTALDTDESLAAEVFQVVLPDLYRPVHAAPPGAREVQFEARATGEYVIRLNQESGIGGLFEIDVDGGAALLFPVAGADLDAVGSWYGDPRDAGARGHEGLDIFAPRGTPVLAAAGGRVTSARSTPVGGKVIWVEDADGDLSYYYAHLDAYHVRAGQWVSAGDVIGTVGNTGNARGVRPHLHFGVYRPGRVALDPAPWLVAGQPVPAPGLELGEAALIGRMARVTGDRVRLRSAPSLGGAILAELGPGTSLRVVGSVADWHRVLLADGTTGFVAARFTTPDEQADW
ncbi:MAG TPA: M23 family metallopeptidase [Longimicrobiales bacterium]|nr:M23 family metallopeptidase [Longimicrobiales bacterium]